MENISLVVFDLDFTLWNCGGTYCDHTHPPYIVKNSRIFDSHFNEINLYPDVIHILEDLYHSGVELAIASKTMAAGWADELLELLKIKPYFSYIEMFPASKIQHIKNIHEQSGIPYSQMYFFDDEYRNIDEVSTLGVNANYIPDGVTYDLVMTSIIEREMVIE